MVVNVSQAPSSKGIGSKVLRTISNHIPGMAVKTIGFCGEIAKMPAKAAVKLAGEFSGYEGGTPIGDMAVNGTLKAAEAVAEKGTKLAINTSKLIAERTYRSLG